MGTGPLEPVRVGVLGAASTAWRRMLPALAGTPGVTVTAIASRDRAKAARFTDRFGGEPVEGYAALVGRADVDAVYVPLPNALHHEWTTAALLAGKHVLAEKPMTTDAAATARLLGLAEANGLVLRENFTFLHHPAHATVRDLCAAGRLGEVRSFTGSFCFPPLPADDVRYRPDLGGGALLDAGVYPIRTAQLLFGDDLEPVGAVLRVDADTGVDVAGTALLVSAAGVAVTAEFGFQHSYAGGYRLWGSTGRLSLDRAFTPPATHQPVLRIDEQDHAEELVLPAADQFARSAAAFADEVRAARAGTPPQRQAGTHRTAELVDAIRALARTTTTSGGR
ncbi:Gfo/Idh/MocA family protein [Umezawaea tangerina]|uniref:Putative dehydrogenase n=1 Tax=Umezawaea tangerina TaxID=84725 RepID=A0A2T0SGG3_9PSEU|nr:Gfo/Idh/MocA family oxidoreductase [Umezawaea tangerina]PRY32495.1 putative dehydrogenase [Umezawaea tangerina]